MIRILKNTMKLLNNNKTPANSNPNEFDKTIDFFIHKIGDIFGDHIQENSFRKILDQYKNYKNKISARYTNEKQIVIKDIQLIKLGLPADNIQFRFIQYAKNVRSFSVTSEIPKIFSFSIEWNNELNCYSRKKKNMLLVDHLSISYYVRYPNFHDLDCHLIIDKNGVRFITDNIHKKTTWIEIDTHPLYQAVHPKIHIKNNLLKVSFESFPLLVEGKKIHKINLTIPLSIKFGF